MKKIPLLLVFIISCALSVPAKAQEEVAAAGLSTGAVQAGTVHKKVGAKKKKPAVRKKKKASAPASEYKFQAADAQPSYRFDKKGEPILKRKKFAAGSSKKRAAGKWAAQALPKLKDHPTGKAAGSTARYVCPMGDYEGDKPGQCPKCGMTLVEKK